MDTRIIPEQLLAGIRQREQYIEQQRHMLQCLELERNALLQHILGEPVSGWKLDLAHGLLVRESSQDAEPMEDSAEPRKVRRSRARKTEE